MKLSMIQPNRAARRLPVFLSLFAIMAMYIVPLIAQWNMQAHGMGAMHMAKMNGSHMDSMMMHHHLSNHSMPAPSLGDHTDDNSMEMSHTHQTTPEDDANDELGLEAACGFCTLLFHLQWLAILTFILPILKPTGYPTTYFQRIYHLLKAVYSKRQPRAPPQFSR